MLHSVHARCIHHSCSLKPLVDSFSTNSVLKFYSFSFHTRNINSCNWKQNMQSRTCSTLAKPHPNVQENRKIGVLKSEQNQLVKQKPVQPVDPHLLKVSVIGPPNAGKSTLANQLMGWKFSAVSKKVHTTRTKSVGVLTEANTQIVFLDTPGLTSSQKVKKHNMEKSLLTDPYSTMFEADLIVAVIDVSKVWNRSELDRDVLTALTLHNDKKSILVLNKVDMVKVKPDLLTVTRLLTCGRIGGQTISHMPDGAERRKPGVTYEDILAKMDHRQMTCDQSLRNSEQGVPETAGVTMVTEETTLQHNNSDIVTKERLQDDVTEERLHDHVTEEHLHGDVTREHLHDDVTKVGLHDDVTKVQDDVTKERLHGDVIKERLHDDVTEEGLHDDVTKERLQAAGSPVSDLVVAEDNGWWKEYNKRLRRVRKQTRGLRGWDGFDRVFMVSAIDGDGVGDIKEYLLDVAMPAPWLYHSSMVTDQDPRELARMCIWEKLLDHLPEEIPYQIKVRLSMWEIDENNILRAVFDLICTRKRHMVRLLGNRGEIIKKISLEAKQDLMNSFRQEMTLSLKAITVPKSRPR